MSDLQLHRMQSALPSAPLRLAPTLHVDKPRLEVQPFAGAEQVRRRAGLPQRHEVREALRVSVHAQHRRYLFLHHWLAVR